MAEKLKGMSDGDGTLLDRSLLLYGTNMGNSNQHQHYDVPHILVGGANGQLRGNRHLHYERKTVTTGNLLASVLNMYGIAVERQGDGDGRLAKL
jgi:anaerobic ribonucleoside-triphosphate reductase